MTRTLRTVAIESLRLPGDWRARLQSHGVQSMFSSGPIIQPPAIVKATREVIFGGDRLAAMHLRGDTEAEVWVYDDLMPEDVEEMRLVENIYRRHDNRDHHLAALVALREKRILAGEDPPPLTQEEGNPGQADHGSTEPRKPGPAKTPRGIAREQVAAAAGITAEAVRNAEKRAKEAAQASDAAADTAEPVAAPPPSATPGLAEAVALDELDRLLMGAVKAITKLAKEHPGLVERFDVAGLKYQLQRVVAPGFRAMRPEGECLYCKRVASEQPNCGACKGSGWGAHGQLTADTPPELLVTGDGAGIFVGGTFRTLKELAESGAKKATKGKTASGRNPQWPPSPSSGAPRVPTERATRTVLEARNVSGGVEEEDFSDAWTEDGDR